MSGIDPALAAQWAEAHRWFAKAAEDRRSAILVLADDPPLLDPAAYHCQQASEKALKGLLVSAGASAPKTHDLRRLEALVAPLYPSLASEIAAVADLTPWGTATRYPDLESDLGVTGQDIRDALENLERLCVAIAALDPTTATIRERDTLAAHEIDDDTARIIKAAKYD